MKNNKQSKTITTTYNIPTQLSGSVHIALISDVHDRCPDAALSILHQQQPDLILVAGDLMERHDPVVSPWTVEQMDEWQGIPRTRTWFSILCENLMVPHHPENKRSVGTRQTVIVFWKKR